MKVFVDVHDKRWNKYKIDFEKIVNAVVSGVYKDSEVSIVLVDDDEIQSINNTYRGIDKPTNVLSFELEDDVLLGDIYISLDTVLRQAKEEGKTFENHTAHMVVHGVFHLLGYDHITDAQAKIMEMNEVKVLKKLGIKNPYGDDDANVCDCVECCPGGRFVSWIKSIKVRENSFWQYALYALFGGVAAFGFAPFYQWWWTILGVAGAYWLTVKNKNIGGFWKALLRVAPFGAMYAVAMFWWVLHSIYVVPELTRQFAIWTIPGLVGLAIAGALIFSWPFVAIAVKKYNQPIRRVLMFSVVWTLVLWGREWIFTGFPWNPIANILMPYPMIANSGAVWGMLGLSFILVLTIAMIVEFLRSPRQRAVWRGMVVVLIVLVCGGLIGYKNMQYSDLGADNPAPMIRIVQPGQSQSQKATHSREQALEQAEKNLGELFGLATLPGNADIIIFPETTYPFVVMPDDDIEFARVLGRPIIIGAMSFDAGKLFNSLVVADEMGNIKNIYSKSHLVPFGEYRPLGFMPAPVDLAAGQGPDVIRVGDFAFAPAICYEVIFSDSLLKKSADGVNAIVNITNDNWFGRTPGTFQHLDMVRRYAIESGLPIVRANYSGISAFVGADGSLISGLGIGQSGVLDGYVWGAHKTPYRVIGLNGWMIIILLVSIAGILCSQKSDE